jgi:hypothetical protein
MNDSPFTVEFSQPERHKHKAQIKKILRIASNSQQIQLAKKAIVTTEEGSQARLALAEKIDRLDPEVRNAKSRFFAIGAIRSGKTFLYLALLCFLCKIFPKSRWLVVRKSSTVLMKTTIPSFELVVRNSQGLYWKRSDKEYYCQFPNGSRVYFMSEGFDSDPKLTKFLGLECNGAFLDQMDELREETYTMVSSRLGSWYGCEGGIIPPILLFGSTNPTWNWFKKLIYDPFKKGTISDDFDIIDLLPSDNPSVTEDQWKNWELLPPDEYARLIRGVWDIEVKGQFMSSFAQSRHVAHADIPLDWKFDIVLSFDFNVDPMTCVMGQTDYRNFIHFNIEFRQNDSDTYALCEAIKPMISGKEHTVVVTGDASGSNRISGTRGHINQYQIIKEQLGLSWEQFKVPKANPYIADSRTFCNALLHRLPILFSPSMEYTIKDMMFTLCDVDREGNLLIKKTGHNQFLGIDNKLVGHHLDNIRYFFHATFTDYLEIPKS